jgi:plastocyanin
MPSVPLGSDGVVEKKMRWLISWRIAVVAILCFCTQGLAQSGAPMSHTIFITALEVKGGTTADKLPPPSIDPRELSKGYDFKRPGEADKNNAQRWEVSSYVLNPAFVAIHQDDAVKLVAFVINGDEHDVRLLDPDGDEVVPITIWHRGRQYELSFVAKKTGSYRLICSQHAPTMTATFLVVPRL